jgi:rubrerythrin
MIEDVTPKKCMEFAIATEELGTRFYRRMASKFSENKEISQVFAQLAEDEQVHKRQFAELLERAPADEGISDAPEKRAYLTAMSISEFFSHSQGPFKNIEDIQNREDALQKALEFEKATLGFYKAVEDVLGRDELLTGVINAEQHHIVVLIKALLVEGSKFRTLQDRWP